MTVTRCALDRAEATVQSIMRFFFNGRDTIVMFDCTHTRSLVRKLVGELENEWPDVHAYPTPEVKDPRMCGCVNAPDTKGRAEQQANTCAVPSVACHVAGCR